MKNFAEINRASTGAKKKINFFEKLWEHSRTLKRVGLVLVMCLITITQAWGYYGIELRSDYYTGGWSYVSDTWWCGGDGQKYWDVYHNGNDSYWRIKIGGDDYGPTGSSDETLNVGYAGYKVGKQSSKSFKTQDDAGILRICSNQVTGGEYSPYVWVERPGVVFKHPWDGTNWTEADATDNRDGTYTYKGTYGGTAYFNAKPVNGIFKVAKTTTTVTGSPTTGDRCEFKWTPTGYKHNGTEEENRGVFVITKLCKIQYNGNGKTGGSVPSDQEDILYNTATTVRGNTGTLVKTNYIFTGWNSNNTGTGAHYAAGSGSISPTATTTTLYAEWEDVWNLKGSWDNWANYKGMSNVSSNTFQVTLSLAASTTYDFKVVKRVDTNSGNDVYYGKASTTFTRSSLTSVKSLVTTGGDTYNMHITTDVAGDYVFTFVYDASASNMKVLVKYPCATAGKTLYKFEVSSSKTSGNVCSVTGTNVDLAPTDPLTKLAGGTLNAKVTSANRLQYASGAFSFKNGEGGVLQIDLDCALQTGDVIRYVNSATGSDYNAYVRHTSSSTAENQQTLASNKASGGEIVLPSAFNGKSTIYIVRGANNSALISYFEIIRPYVVSLNASENGGKVNSEDSEVHYMLAGETLILPHATKASNRFKGWFTTAGGSSEAANPYTAAGTTTLYAQFEDCPTGDATVYKFQVKTGLTNGTKTAGDLNVGNFLSTLDGGTAVMTGTHAQIVNNNAISFANNGDYITVDLDCALQTGDTIITTISGSKSGIKITSTSSTTSLKDISYGTKVKTIVPSGLNNYKTFRLYRQDSNAGGISYFEIKRPAHYTITHDLSHVTTSSPEEVIHKAGYTATYTADDGYELPDAVTVMRGVTDITTNCTWSAGTVTIPAADCIGDITISVTGEEVSCSATAPGSISKGSASGGTGTITLTAAGDPATNNTWYWQSAADGTATNLGSGATKDVSATGTYYLRSYCSDNGGCWSDAVSVTVAAADLLTTPTATFSNSYYIIGGSSLDLSSLWTSDSEGSVTYSVPSAGGTGASISTAAFTATTAGTATVRASQAANGNYSAIYKDATITVLPGYATSIDFEDIIDVSGTSAAWKTTMEGQNYKLTQSDGSKWTLDDGTSGTKQADKGLKIKETGDNAGKIAFAVHANQTVELKVGTLAGTASGKASFSINGGASYSDITGASTASTGTPVTYTYKGNADRVYVFKTKSSSWNILQHITIGYKVTYDKGSNGTGTVDPMYKTHGTSLTLSSSTFSRDDYIQDGWSTIDGGDKVYDLGGSYTSNAEITLYPHWVVACTDPGLAYATGSVTKTLCDGSFTNTLTNNHSVAVTYTSSNTSVADVASDGAITIKAAGSTTITASSIAQTVSAVDYCADEASYTLTVSASTAAGLAYGTSTVKKDVGDDAFTNSLTNTHSLTVTYTSSDESVATVASNGAVTIKAAGTATITARSAQQEVSSTCYAAGEASYTLTVYPVYTVTYNAMGGTCGTSSANTNLGKVTLPSATHASYTTYEWVTSNGSSVGDADDDYEPSGNITLYAKWSGSCAGGGGSTTIYAMHMTAYNSYSNDESTTGTTTLAFASDNTVPVSDVVYYKPNSTNAIIVDFSTSAYTLQAGDVITFYCVSNNASEKNVGFTIHATSSGDAIGTANVNATNKARVAASYTVVAETALVGVNKIWCNRVGAETRFHDMTITRGGSSCHTVTYHGNGATSGYVNDPVQHTAGSDATVLYNDPTTGFKRTGYEFNGWNTKADASGTHYDYWDIDHRTIEDIAADVDLYAEWRIVIDADNTDFAGKDSPTQYKDVKVTNGATLTITNATTMRDVTVTNGATLKIQKGTTVHDITVETGSTLNVSTNSGSAITLTANSLSLVGGWGTVGNETKYDMPRVYINPASKIERTDKTINFDINVDNRNYYPIALPFEVSMSDVTYKDDILAAAASERYGSIYAVKTYNGQNRADGAYPVWRLVSKSETLKPGHGYILCAVPALAWGHEKEIIRFPMKNVADEWLSNGELGHYTDGKSVEHIKDTVHVTAYKKEEGETAKSNIGWNLLGVPYMSCYTSDEIAASDDAALITGQLDINTGKYKDGDDNIYVSVPTYNFSEYVQENINDAVLLPGWCFFIQVEESGTLTFDKDGENLPIYAPKREKAMPTVKTGIILSGAGAKDKTTILVSDKYNAADYEINADLEKLFGEESFTLATYSLSGETRLAYNALSNADAANIIPIGYRAPADGEYTFSINPRYAENGAFEHVNLIDYETGIMTDLLMGSYTFSTERTQLDTRFALNVVPRQNTPTDIETVGGEGFDANAPRKVLINDKMYIIVDGKMYDATGKSVK